LYLCKTLRGGAEVARWAHNPKVIGSNPVPATTRPQHEVPGFFFIRRGDKLAYSRQDRKKKDRVSEANRGICC
jgi:hypothetical protein